MNSEMRVGDRYFQGTSLYPSQAIQSKLFHSTVKRNTLLNVRMSNIEEYPPTLPRRTLTMDEWENIGRTCTVLYLVVLIVLSIGLPVAYFLNAERLNLSWQWLSPGTALWSFNIFMYSVALLFLVVLSLYINCTKRRARKFKHEPRTENNNNDSQRAEEVSTIGDRNNESNVWRRTLHLSNSNNGSEVSTTSSMHFARNKRGEYLYAYGAPGVNFFLRVGAIAFAFGTIMLDGFRLARFIEDDKAIECFGPLYILQIALRITLVFSETLFMTKNHTIVLNFKRGWLTLGLGHLIATNMSMWAVTIIVEAYEGFEHTSEWMAESDSSEVEENSHNLTSSHSSMRRRLLNEESNTPHPGECSDSLEVLEDELAPYLYPLVIEFALIAAAILYKIHSNIGKLHRIEHRAMLHRTDPEQHEFSLKTHAECHKANTGIFLGLLILVANLMVTIIYLSSENENLKQWLYMIGDISMQCLGILVIILAFFQTSKLDFNGHIESKIDVVLLVLTISGLYLLLFCSILPYIFMEERVKWLWVVILEDASNFVQSTLQMLFIFDGFQRQTTTPGQWHHKPGRSFVSFLLFINLSMWLINSFELKEALVGEVMMDFYGATAWTMILYLSLPLSVFFRFHSVVCLSDIWVESYPKKLHLRNHFTSGDDNGLYHNAQLQSVHDKLKAAEDNFSQHVTRISNTDGDNTI